MNNGCPVRIMRNGHEASGRMGLGFQLCLGFQAMTSWDVGTVKLPFVSEWKHDVDLHLARASSLT